MSTACKLCSQEYTDSIKYKPRLVTQYHHILKYRAFLCFFYLSIFNSTFHGELLYVLNIYLPQTPFFVYLYLPMKNTCSCFVYFLCVFVGLFYIYIYIYPFETTEYKSLCVLTKTIFTKTYIISMQIDKIWMSWIPFTIASYFMWFCHVFSVHSLTDGHRVLTFHCYRQ